MNAYFCLIVVCVFLNSFGSALYYGDESEVQEACCSHAETVALTAASASACAATDHPDDVDPLYHEVCTAAIGRCCKQHFKDKDDCTAGMKLAAQKRCGVPKTDIGKSCCEECSLGRWAGTSQGKDACGEVTLDAGPVLALRSYAYATCCNEAAEQEITTTEKIVSTTEEDSETTTNEVEDIKEKCNRDSCEQICEDESGTVQCRCENGFRLQSDNRSCKDVNECDEAKGLCTAEGEECRNTNGSYKCVQKREAGTCPPGFKFNPARKVCDDINECLEPRPPCLKYLCVNTIGGFKCGGKPGKPYVDGGATAPVLPTPAPTGDLTSPKNDICPQGFRAGPDDECLDIDECEEHLDDCQRLSQHCINTHGGFFCQDHVSKRCAPGFKVNSITGICEDINECEDTLEVCRRTEVCVNLPGAYNCKSKISTLPKLATKNCKEGTRIRPGGTICEDIDECREGTHLCDSFQNCINTFGGHECRCKEGYELDSSLGSCVDIDECALRLDNCGEELTCKNLLGRFTCERKPPSTPAPSSTPVAYYEEEYYDEDTSGDIPDSLPPSVANATTPKPSSPPGRPSFPSYPNNPYQPRPTPTTRKPAYTNTPERPTFTQPTPPTTTSTTTEALTTIDNETQPEETTVSEEIDSTTPIDIPPPPELPPKPASPRRPETRTTERPRRPSYPPNRPVERPTWPISRPDVPNRPEYRPERPTEAPRTPKVAEVTVPTPVNPNVIEKDKDYDGSYGLNTSDIPKNEWTNVIGRDKPDDKELDVIDDHCLYGYEKNAEGYCVDVNECDGSRHICSNLETCVNMPGGYRCDCVAGYTRSSDGWCVPRPPPVRPTPRTTTSTTSTTTSTTTERTTTEVSTTPKWRYPTRNPPSNGYCGLGYEFDYTMRKCVDINECASPGQCAPLEDCHNVDGGYYCKCGVRCRAASEKPYEPLPTFPPREPFFPQPPRDRFPQPSYPPRDPYPDNDPESNIITVGAQYGQRGMRVMRPNFSRLHNTGAIYTYCPWGYELTPEKMCYDIDECAKNVSQCGPQQRCENFYGGYSCQCPAGHKIFGKDGCEDIDECRYGRPCSHISRCVNSVGSYRCECDTGYRSSPSNDKVCVDVDECTETPDACQQECVNFWGGYKCECKRGYRLSRDNRTCVDVDECAEYSSSRHNGKLCIGDCVNEPGSYRCTCPAGYRVSDDTRSCKDINECETGEAPCASTREPGHVCQNTRGSYHCHRIECPPGYKLEDKHRCTRIQRSCQINDWRCLQQPSGYTYNFITFVANLYLPQGSVDLFTMHGPSWRESSVSFELSMIAVNARHGVRPADLSCFDVRPTGNMCVLSLLCSLGGPQVAELELAMSLHQRGQFAGSAVARLIIIVSEYEF